MPATPLRQILGRSSMVWMVALTLVIELLCVVLRFGFGFTSTASTASTIGVLTMGYRVHHGYLGIVMACVGFSMVNTRYDFGWGLLIVGLALLISDLIHHFVVLWLITGSPQFDWVYPQ